MNENALANSNAKLMVNTQGDGSRDQTMGRRNDYAGGNIDFQRRKARKIKGRGGKMKGKGEKKNGRGGGIRGGGKSEKRIGIRKKGASRKKARNKTRRDSPNLGPTL